LLRTLNRGMKTFGDFLKQKQPRNRYLREGAMDGMGGGATMAPPMPGMGGPGMGQGGMGGQMPPPMDAQGPGGQSMSPEDQEHGTAERAQADLQTAIDSLGQVPGMEEEVKKLQDVLDKLGERTGGGHGGDHHSMHNEL
jgi:hypothetical protein